MTILSMVENRVETLFDFQIYVKTFLMQGVFLELLLHIEVGLLQETIGHMGLC